MTFPFTQNLQPVANRKQNHNKEPVGGGYVCNEISRVFIFVERAIFEPTTAF